MTAGRNSGAAGIVALALDFHRAPARHADLLHGRAPLPPAVGVLLKLAGGSAPDSEWAALAPPEALQAAALFFIEQVLLHHDSDHYRVLGVAPDASTELIKEHHRLLMRVFHPDRENRADDWKDAFATRINLAYTGLRDAEARRHYDALLRTGARPGVKLPAARRTSVAPPKPALPRSRSSGLPPMLLRYLPQWVLAGSALIALMVVGAVYLNNPPAPVTLYKQTVMQAVVLPEDAGETRNTATANPLQPAAASAQPVELAAPALAPAVAPVVPASAQVAAPPQSATRLAQAEPAVLSAAVRTQRPPVTPTPQPSASVPVKSAAQAVPLATPAPAQSAPPRATQPEPRAADVASQADPDVTLAQFMATFERGDTQAFMALFDEVAIGRAGGKSNIRREHESLFQSTELRHIAIDGMNWSREGDLIRGEGRYRTTLMRKGELVLRTETGVFRVQLLRRGDQALIIGIDLQPGGAS